MFEDKSRLSIDPHHLWSLEGEEFARLSATARGLTFIKADDYWMVLTRERESCFNIASIDSGTDPAARLHACYSRLQGERLLGLISLTEQVAGRLRKRIQQMGLRPVDTQPHMACLPPDFTPRSPGIGEITLVQDPKSLQDSNWVKAATFGFHPATLNRVTGDRVYQDPGVAIWLKYCDSQPVSTVTTVTTGQVVGIWDVATLPEQQGRGYGRGLLEHAMTTTLAAGAKVFHLSATRVAQPLYERLGFYTINRGLTLPVRPYPSRQNN